MLKKKKHIINGLFIVFPITVLYNNFAFWNIAMEGKKMSAKKSKMKNLTEGSPAKLIIGFAIPMFGGHDDRGKVFGIKTVGGGRVYGIS